MLFLLVGWAENAEIHIVGENKSLADKRHNLSKDLSRWLKVAKLSISKDDGQATIEYNSSYVDGIKAAWASDYQWKVYKDNSCICVIPYEPAASNLFSDNPREYTTDIIDVDDGTIVAMNDMTTHGYGGIVLYIDGDKELSINQSAYIVSFNRVLRFYKYNSIIYALEGSEVGKNNQILKIRQENGRWEADRYIRLPDKPVAMTMDNNGNIIVVTRSSIFVIENRSLKILYSEVQLKCLNKCLFEFDDVNSVVVDSDNNIFLGMLQGVAKITIQDQRVEIFWLVPDEKILRDDLLNALKHEWWKHNWE